MDVGGSGTMPPMGTDTLVIHGAREHNLKNITLELPRNALVVFTGLSGSGKSSLAFDTIYAEGQRRYVESLSAYARQFLGQMEKPDVDFIEGLSPAISIDQKSASRNPRSTVGTITEIYDYLRLLYARIGVPHCPNCGREIASQSLDRIVDLVMTYPQDTRINVLAPIVRGRKGEFKKELQSLRTRGFTKARVDGQMRSLEEEISRVMRSRVVNPKWIDGVKRHGYKGAFEIIATVDYMFAFAATTGAVKTHHFDLAFEAFVEDEATRDFIQSNNRFGYDELIAKFTDARERGYWQPRSNRAAQLLEAA